MKAQQGIAIFGATGSVGTSALAVVDRHPDRFRPVVLSAHRNAAALASLVQRYEPQLAVLSGAATIPAQGNGTRWRAGREALLDAARLPEVDVVLNALVGAAGLELTLAALEAGKRVALANKESLVCGGQLVLDAARLGGGELLPVDSEHSAIFQCLGGRDASRAMRLVLTASGGPFRSLPAEQIADVSAADALLHPTWDMGAKITIDSATLANKALEIIEAHFLFGVPYDRIEAVVHPQSIVHSMVEFRDGSVLAQMGFPTMEIPILHALSFPEPLAYEARRFDPVAASPLTFEPVRADCFPAFALGVAAGRAGGTAPAVFNAANEIAVAAFLAGRIGFPEIPASIESALATVDPVPATSLDAVLDADARARRATETFLRKQALC